MTSQFAAEEPLVALSTPSCSSPSPAPAPEETVVGAAGDARRLPLPKAESWSVSFGPSTKSKGAGKKEKEAILASKLRGGRVSASSNANSDAEGGARTPTEVGEDGGVTGTTRALVSCSSAADADFLQIDLAVAIPRNLPTTRADMAKRNFIDTEQMLCMVRQYKASCGVSSLTSVWNRLYSVIGAGTLPPVSQEEVMSILGFQPPFEAIRWGPFTGNSTLMRWFHTLNKHFGVRGKASYLYKVHGYGRTMLIGDDAEKGRKVLVEAIKNPQCGVIYHCLNHYMVPLGFIESPKSQLDVYSPTLSDSDTFILIGEVSRGKHPPMHVKKWDDIATDLNCSSPNFFNIRATELGVQKREKCKVVGRNIHCLMSFRSDEVEEDVEAFLNACEGEGVEGEDE